MPSRRSQSRRTLCNNKKTENFMQNHPKIITCVGKMEWMFLIWMLFSVRIIIIITVVSNIFCVFFLFVQHHLNEFGASYTLRLLMKMGGLTRKQRLLLIFCFFFSVSCVCLFWIKKCCIFCLMSECRRTRFSVIVFYLICLDVEAIVHPSDGGN